LVYPSYNISLNIVKPSCDRAQGIINFKEPSTKKELQRFIGLLNYDRQFVRNQSEILKPFYSLLAKDAKFYWSEKLSNNFKTVKEIWKKDLNWLYQICKKHLS
jgi:hypothetical protein